MSDDVITSKTIKRPSHQQKTTLFFLSVQRGQFRVLLVDQMARSGCKILGLFPLDVFSIFLNLDLKQETIPRGGRERWKRGCDFFLIQRALNPIPMLWPNLNAPRCLVEKVGLGQGQRLCNCVNSQFF